MKRVIKISVMVLVAVFAISTAASAQTKKWAYQSELWGFVDKTGKVVIPCKYRSAAWFSEGLSAVTENYNDYGYIDKTGKVVIPFNFKNAYSFEKGKAKVQDADRQWRKIDKTGKYIE